MNKIKILLCIVFASCFFKKKHNFYVGFYGGFNNYDTKLIVNNGQIYHKRLDTNYSIVKAGGLVFSAHIGDTLIIFVDNIDSDTIILEKKRPYIPISIKDSMISYGKPTKQNRW